jgi:hypothetical protein
VKQAHRAPSMSRVPRAIRRTLGVVAPWVFGGAALGCSDALPLVADESPGPTQAATVEMRFGGEGYQEATSIAASDSVVVVAGRYAEGLSYGDAVAFTGTSESDGFILGLSSNGDGSVRFAHSLAGIGEDVVGALAAAPDDAFIAGGHVSQDSVLGDVVLPAARSGSAFLAKLDAEGGVAWTRVAAGDGVQSVNAITVAEDGSVYAVGDFSGVMDFGLGELTATGDSDAFVARFSSEGEAEWIAILGGESAQLLHRLLLLSDGSLLVAGAYQGELAVGDRVWTVNHSLHQTPFVAGFAENGELDWVQSEVIEHDHLRYLEEQAQNPHTGMHTYVERPSLAERASGGALAVVAHGEFLSRHGQDFEAPAVSTLTLLAMEPGGGVGTRASLAEPRSLIQIAGAVRVGEATRFVGSYTGELTFEGSRFTAWNGRRLLFAEVSDDGAVREPSQFGLDGAGLTAHAAATRGNAVWVAARAVDLATHDNDILIGRFDF